MTRSRWVRWLAVALVPAAAALAGCGGDDESDKAGGGGPAGAPAPRPAESRVLGDPLLGYELRLPEGWTAPAQQRPGAAVPLGGEGRGCSVGTAGTLPDVSSSRRLVDYAREVATDRAAEGAVVQVGAVRGANVDGAVARIEQPDAGARSALFASAGGGVAITCTAPRDRLEALDRALPVLYAGVRLTRDRRLEALQREVVAVAGVDAAALRAERGTVTARLELDRFERARAALVQTLRLMAAKPGDGQVAISATDPGRPELVSLGRAVAGAQRGTVQVPPGEPERVRLVR